MASEVTGLCVTRGLLMDVIGKEFVAEQMLMR